MSTKPARRVSPEEEELAKKHKELELPGHETRRVRVFIGDSSILEREGRCTSTAEQQKSQADGE